MKLNIFLVLLLLATLSQARRVKFLSHISFEETPAKSEEFGQGGQSGNGEESPGNEEGEVEEKGHGESGDGEEEHSNDEEANRNGEENQGEEGNSEENQGEEGNGGEGHGEEDKEKIKAQRKIDAKNTNKLPLPVEPEWTEQEMCYGVIFDAGNTSTKVFVYSWPCRTINYENPEIEIYQQAPSTKVTPGISSFGNNISGVKEYLQPLIEWAGEQVKTDIRSRTPILFGATDGMRILDWSQQFDLIEEARNILRNSGYLFETAEWARVISGKDEGAYLWLTVNFLKGLFNNDNLDDDGRLRESYTTINLGSASTQLTDDITNADQYHLQQDDTYDTDYRTAVQSIFQISLYSHSWLYYGQDQARELTNSFLQSSHKRSSSIYNPCFLKGYTNDLKEGVTVKGSGNADDCRDLIDLYLRGFSSSCDQCAIQESYIPSIRPDSKVYASGAFVAASKILSNPQSFTWPDFNVYNDICSQEFDSQNSDNDYATQCFLGIYTQELLSMGYRIPSDTVIETGDIHEMEPSWTLAAMFDQIDDNSSCSDSPTCNFRRHIKEWRKESTNPAMKEHKPYKPLSQKMP